MFRNLQRPWAGGEPGPGCGKCLLPLHGPPEGPRHLPRSAEIAVFRIRDISVWIRIRIRGSMRLTNGSGSGFRCGSGSRSCYFRYWPSWRQKKLSKKKNFCLLLFEGTFTSFFNNKKSKRSHKTVGIKVFLTILLDDRRMIEGSGSGSTSD